MMTRPALRHSVWWLLRWLIALFRGARKPRYSSPRMHHVRRLASGWASSGSGKHPMTKPDWVKSAVLQLANNLPNTGCRTLANSFNLAHASSGHSISKTWVYVLVKARACALALARMKSLHR